MNPRGAGLGAVVAVAAVSLLAACSSAGGGSPYDDVRLGDAVLAVQVGSVFAEPIGDERDVPPEHRARIVLVAADGTTREVPASTVVGGSPVWTPEALYIADSAMLYRISAEQTSLSRIGIGREIIAGVPSEVGDTVRWASIDGDLDRPITLAKSHAAQGAMSGRSVGRAVHALATCDDGVYAIAGGLVDVFADSLTPEVVAAAGAVEDLVSFHIREWDGSEQRGDSAPDDAAIGTHTVAPCVDGVVHRLVYARADRERVTGGDAALVLRSWDTRVGSRTEVALHGAGVEALAEAVPLVGIQADAMSVVDGTMHWYDDAEGRFWATDLMDGATRVVANLHPSAAEGAVVRVVFGPTSALVLTVLDEVGAAATLSRVDLMTGETTPEMAIAALTPDALAGAPVQGIAVRPDLLR